MPGTPYNAERAFDEAIREKKLSRAWEHLARMSHVTLSRAIRYGILAGEEEDPKAERGARRILIRFLKEYQPPLHQVTKLSEALDRSAKLAIIQRWARPPITCFPPHGREATVPFIGFAEAFVLSSFRRAGVPLQRIRPAVEVLEKEIGVDHALASKRLYTDGAEVLFDYATKRGEREVMELVVVRTQQRQFSGVVKDYLKRIHYGGDGWADSVRLPTYGNAKVVVDPKGAFGLPIVAHSGARVENLVDRFQAGDSVAEIATDFSVSPDEVEDVIRLATRTAA